MDKSAAPKKTVKPKGPIRTEALIPFIIFCILVWAYFAFLFDGQLRRGLEWVGSKVNTAEVNVGSLKSSFIRGELTINKIEITDRNQPKLNKVELGEIKFSLLWDALLRAKFVVKQAGLLGVQVNTPRASEGFVFPLEQSQEPGLVDELKSKALAELKAQYQKSSFSSLISMLEGFDPSKGIGNLGELKTEVHLKNLQSQITQKEKEWTQTLNSFGKDDEISKIQTRISNVKIGGSPQEMVAQTKELNDLIGESQRTIQGIQTKATALTQDVNAMSKGVSEIDDWIAKDRNELESKLKLPKLDSKSLSDQLFGNRIASVVGDAQKYTNMARKYMPAKKSGDQEKDPAFIPHPRGVGRTYDFGRPKSYPLFWLMQAELSSPNDHSPFGGPVKGEIRNITSQPAVLGLPTEVEVLADFPNQNIRTIEFKASFDHTKAIASDSFVASVGAYPIETLTLSDAPEFKLGFNKAKGSAKLGGALVGNQIELSVQNSFNSVDYFVDAQSKLLKEVVTGIVTDIPRVDVGAKVSGTWDALNISIQSNLADAIGKGFGKMFEKKLKEARDQLNRAIKEKVDTKRKEVTEKFESTKQKVTSQVDEKKKKAETLLAQANSKLDAVKKQSTQGATKALDGLKKKLKF